MCLINAQSLITSTQRLKLRNFLLSNNIDLLFITETWLYDEIENHEIFPASGYHVLMRIDRTSGAHGGVLIAVRVSLELSILSSFSYSDFCCSIIINFHKAFYSFLLIYNPPQTSLFRVDSSVLVEAMFNHRDEVVKCLGRKVAKDRVVTAVLGDINLPDVCWSSHTATSDYSNKFLTALDDLDLLQIVDFSTIVSGNILDLLCVSDPHRFIVFRGATAFSDHFPVFAHVFAASSISHFTTKRSVTYSKSSLNSESFSRAISPLYSILHSNCHNEFIDKFNETVCQALDSSCRKITTRRKDFPFYFSSHSIHIANKLRTPNNLNCFNRQYLSQLENDFSNSVELDKTLLIQRFSPNSSKHAFMFLDQFKSTQPVPTKLFWGRKQVESDVLISETFNQYFASVYQLSENSPSAGGGLADSEIKLSEVDVSPSIVGELLAKCKETRSTDNIPAFIYKSCHSILSPLVSFLFLSIIQSCVWPDSWKTALITPVFKSGSPYDITNYRPVSILPPLSLIFERILFNYIYPRVRYKISNAQHGFRKKRSTITQMLSYLDEVYHTHDAKIPCAAMYFDFSKAFDSVRHDILVQKFAAFGFDDIFTALLISYLSNRFQCVKVRTSISTTLPVTSGVPQGSVLGPLLFILFINDLPDIFNHSNCFLFADDSKFICKTNCSDLQSDVDSFTHWCTQNGLKINKDKCNFIIFNGKFPDCIFVNNQPIHSINLLKDLGLLVSSDLTWSNHIGKKTSIEQ